MEEIKSPIFLEQFLEEKYHPNNLKDDFSSKKDAFIFTSMKPQLLDRSNNTRWVFGKLK